MTEVPGTPAGVPAETAPPALGAPVPTPPVGTDEKMFPESYVKQLRDENATHRIAARDAAEATRAAVLGEVQVTLGTKDAEITRLTDELGSAWILAQKIQSSIDAGIPAEKLLAFAEVVKGVDAASIKSSAESLKALLGISHETPVTPGATDPSQGRGQRGLANPGQDPILKALTEASSRR